mmetsp:Transcript_3690/g.13335  ORF Transcript_3690/g.13335 Transcript_3690/m.13335 type:complete len:262 (-) Transcript_3690:286-1071(-)
MLSNSSLTLTMSTSLLASLILISASFAFVRVALSSSPRDAIHRGESGNHNEPASKTAMSGVDSKNNCRHPPSVLITPSLAKYPSKIPPTINPSLSDTKLPRNELGAVSLMYTGALCIANPMPKPYINFANTNSSKPGANDSVSAPAKYNDAAIVSSFREPSFSPKPAPHAALAINAPNSDALTNCPDCIELSANPSPPCAALLVRFSNAPLDMPISHPNSAPARAGKRKLRSTAPLSSDAGSAADASSADASTMTRSRQPR